MHFEGFSFFIIIFLGREGSFFFLLGQSSPEFARVRQSSPGRGFARVGQSSPEFAGLGFARVRQSSPGRGSPEFRQSSPGLATEEPEQQAWHLSFFGWGFLSFSSLVAFVAFSSMGDGLATKPA